MVFSSVYSVKSTTQLVDLPPHEPSPKADDLVFIAQGIGAGHSPRSSYEIVSPLQVSSFHT